MIKSYTLLLDLSASVLVLDGRVETIEGTVSDHEERLTSTEAQIEGELLDIIILFN